MEGNGTEVYIGQKEIDSIFLAKDFFALYSTALL